MAKTFDLRAERRKREIHLEGGAVCLSCRHRWEAVVLPGVTELECPKCGLMRGVLTHNCFPERYWECECGCVYFTVGESHVVCAFCGLVLNFPN